MANYVGAVAVPCPIRQENGFRLDPAELASLVTARTKLVIINSPANPTGGVSTRQDLERIAAVAREHDLTVLADEDLRPDTVRGGARLDRIAARHGRADDRPRRLLQDVRHDRLAARLRHRSEALVTPFSRLIVNSVSCTNAATQWAGVEALTVRRTRSTPWWPSSRPGATSSSTD